MAISATENPLGKVFTSDYQLTIPSFQRAYTWQAENIEQLVNDLQDACADPGHALLPRLAHPRQGRPHPIPGHRRPTAPHLPVNHRLRAARTGRRPRPHRQPQRPHFGTRPTNSAASKPRTTTHPARTRHRLLPHVRAGRRFGRPVRSEDNDIASHAQRNIAVNTRRTFDLLAAMDAKDRRRFASYLVNGVTLVIVTTTSPARTASST